MANIEEFKKTFDQSRTHYFGEKFKKEVVKRIERNEFSVSEASNTYEVSRTSLYRWVYKYSKLYRKGYRQVIEPMSSTKKIKGLQSRIKELELIVGQKQIKLDYLSKLIEIAEKDYQIEIVKKNIATRSSGSGKIVKR
jgi:transposase-like protein